MVVFIESVLETCRNKGGNIVLGEPKLWWPKRLWWSQILNYLGYLACVSVGCFLKKQQEPAHYQEDTAHSGL